MIQTKFKHLSNVSFLSSKFFLHTNIFWKVSRLWKVTYLWLKSSFSRGFLPFSSCDRLINLDLKSLGKSNMFGISGHTKKHTVPFWQKNFWIYLIKFDKSAIVILIKVSFSQIVKLTMKLDPLFFWKLIWKVKFCQWQPLL